MEDSSKKLNIVYFMRYEWDSSFRRPYHLEMSKHCRMLGVEFPVTLDLPFRYWSSFKQWLMQKPKLREINKNLHLYRPFSLVCYYVSFRFPFLIKVNRWLLSISLKPVLKRLGMKNVVVIINHPTMKYVIGALDEKILCYEVFDEYTKEYGLSSRLLDRTRLAEQYVLKKADVVFTSSRMQMENRKEFNDNINFVPHAVDSEVFMRALDSDTRVPNEVAVIPRPRLGFIGNMTPSVDMKLLIWLMDKHPEWSLLIVGKREEEPVNVSDLLNRSNVFHLGFKDYYDLPPILKGMDVGLIPYVLDDGTKTVYPNKLYQYLAAGKPVVSTAMPELKNLRGIIDWAETYYEFETQVSAALKGKNTDIDKRICVAQENTIVKRTAEKVQILKRFFI